MPNPLSDNTDARNQPPESSPSSRRTPIRTQKQLAELAGVSLNTINNAINRPELVHEFTRQRIFQLMEEHDYHPDGVARSMVRGRTDVLGIVVPTLEVGYYAKLVSAVERSANERGYHCLISQHLDDPAKEEREVTMMRRHRVDGMIIRNCGRAGDNAFIQRLCDAGMPFVLIDGRTDGFDTYFVGGDDRADADRLVSHLIDQGHRRIAHLAWTREEHLDDSPRYQGYCDAIRRHNFPIDERLICLCSSEYAGGADEMRTILVHCNDDPPTAVFAINDHTALGALAELRRIGRRVPEEIVVASFGGYLDPRMLPAALTIIEQAIDRVASVACERLIAQINRSPVAPGPIRIAGEIRQIRKQQ